MALPRATFEFWRGADVFAPDPLDVGPLMLLIQRCGGPKLDLGGSPSGIGMWVEDDVAQEAAAALTAWLGGVKFPPSLNSDGKTIPPPPPPYPYRSREACIPDLVPPTEVVERFVEWAGEGGFGYRLLYTEA